MASSDSRNKTQKVEHGFWELGAGELRDFERKIGRRFSAEDIRAMDDDAVLVMHVALKDHLAACLAREGEGATERDSQDSGSSQPETDAVKNVTFGQLRRRERPTTPEMKETAKRLEAEFRAASEEHRRARGLAPKIDCEPRWKENERDSQPTDQNTFVCSVSRCGVEASSHEPETGSVTRVEKKFWLAYVPDDIEDLPEAVAEWAKTHGYRPAHFMEYLEFGDWLKHCRPEIAQEYPMACRCACRRFDWAMRFTGLEMSGILGVRHFEYKSRILMAML